MLFRGVVYEINICNKKQTNYNFKFSSYEQKRFKPLYQKKATLLDALCHALESFWSINSTFESKKYSERAIELILENRNQYLKENEDANYKMLEASYMAGKAINIAKTTAGHAMSYQLSMMYGIAHGHAAGLCVIGTERHEARRIDNQLRGRSGRQGDPGYSRFFGC